MDNLVQIKAIKAANHLKTHINSVHKGKKNHKCHMWHIKKAFSDARSLKKHISLGQLPKKIRNVTQYVELI